MAGWDQRCYQARDRPSSVQTTAHLLLIQARMQLRLPKETIGGENDQRLVIGTDVAKLLAKASKNNMREKRGRI